MASSWEIGGIPKFPKLEEDISADIAIVGGGLAGLWCAYLLGSVGKRVVVLEKDRLGHGETLYTSAFITQVLDTPLTELIKIFGKDNAKLAWQSGQVALDLIESTIKKERIDCEFERVPLHIFASSDSEDKKLKSEDLNARKLGFDTMLSTNQILEFKNSSVLEIRRQAKYHPMRFLNGLLESMKKMGVKIFENTEATKLTGKSEFAISTKDGHKVETPKVIIATYEPFSDPEALHLRKGMYTSYCIEKRVKRGILPEGLYLDMHSPYHYIRIDKCNSREDRLIVGGEDHRSELKKQLGKKSLKGLKEFTHEMFPGLKGRIVNQWSGSILESVDGLAFIGEHMPGQYVATAFSGNGMTYAPISAMLISDLVLGRKNPWKELYDPLRKISAKALAYKARDYTGEFIGGALKNIWK